MFGRRTVKIGDIVAIDTPYFNGIAEVIDGPSTEQGTESIPKFLFRFKSGVIVDNGTGFVDALTDKDQVWLEDYAKYISIFGVDDENISLL